MQFATILVLNPGPNTTLKLGSGMTGDDINDLAHKTAGDAIVALEREKQKAPGAGGAVLVYHEDNGQLCLMRSVEDLLECNVIDQKEATKINARLRSARKRA